MQRMTTNNFNYDLIKRIKNTIIELALETGLKICVNNDILDIYHIYLENDSIIFMDGFRKIITKYGIIKTCHIDIHTNEDLKKVIDFENSCFDKFNCKIFSDENILHLNKKYCLFNQFTKYHFLQPTCFENMIIEDGIFISLEKFRYQNTQMKNIVIPKISNMKEYTILDKNFTLGDAIKYVNDIYKICSIKRNSSQLYTTTINTKYHNNRITYHCSNNY